MIVEEASVRGGKGDKDGGGGEAGRGGSGGRGVWYGRRPKVIGMGEKDDAFLKKIMSIPMVMGWDYNSFITI